MVTNAGTVSSLDQRTGCGRLYRNGSRRGVIALPGATYDRNWWFDLDSATYEMRILTDGYGFPVASIGTFDTWGNSTQRTNVSTLYTNCVGGLFSSDTKVHILGVSAGGLTALNWAKNNPTLVQSITLLIPVIDVQAVYDENRSSFASSISTAYSGRPSDANNPADNASSFSGFPIRIYYSENDAVTTTTETLTFASACGAETLSMGPVGHFWGPPWNGYAVGEFMRAHD